jgi:hypothetical protein
LIAHVERDSSLHATGVAIDTVEAFGAGSVSLMVNWGDAGSGAVDAIKDELLRSD